MNMRKHWSLAQDLTFLNHGSYGACPNVVIAHQAELRAALEHDPVRFYERWYPTLHRQAREGLAKFIDVDMHDLALVQNATVGVNTILRTLPFEKGDEVLTTNHIYGACRHALDFLQMQKGVVLKVVSVPFPLKSSRQIVDALAKGITPKTKLLFIDHVTSSTALIMPVAELISMFRAKNIDVLVDGAHAPGMLDLSIRKLNPTYYVGNCHKWMCAPKGAGFLYVERRRQEGFRPLIVSHGVATPLQPGESRFEAEFAWAGTDDCTPVLSIPKTIELVADLYDGGWPAIRKHNAKLALAARNLLLEALEIGPAPCPDDMIGSMVALPLSKLIEKGIDPERLHDLLLDEHRIQVPVTRLTDTADRFLRISAQLYNTIEDYEKLAEVLVNLIQR